MAIQMRRGHFEKFDPSKLLPAEWAIVLAGDNDSPHGKGVYMCFGAGDVRRMIHEEDFTNELLKNIDDVKRGLTRDVKALEQNIKEAESLRVSSENTRKDAEKHRGDSFSELVVRVNKSIDNCDNISKETKETNELAKSTEALRTSSEETRQQKEAQRQEAENGRVSKEQERCVQEQGRVREEQARIAKESARNNDENVRKEHFRQAKFDEEARVAAERIRISNENERVENEKNRKSSFREMIDAAQGIKTHVCSSSEYDTNGRKPKIARPTTGVIYLVPTAEDNAEDSYLEFIWINERFEKIGSTATTLKFATREEGSQVGVDGSALEKIEGAETKCCSLATLDGAANALSTTLSQKIDSAREAYGTLLQNAEQAWGVSLTQTRNDLETKIQADKTKVESTEQALNTFKETTTSKLSTLEQFKATATSRLSSFETFKGASEAKLGELESRPVPAEYVVDIKTEGDYITKTLNTGKTLLSTTKVIKLNNYTWFYAVDNVVTLVGESFNSLGVSSNSTVLGKLPEKVRPPLKILGSGVCKSNNVFQFEISADGTIKGWDFTNGSFWQFTATWSLLPK